jgi:DNA-binding NarL/FixJ family response regulator
VTPDGSEKRVAVGLASVFGAIALLAAIDLAGDARSATTFRHVVVEAAVLAAGLGGFLWMAARLRTLASDRRELTARLDVSLQEAAKWRQEAGDLIAGLSDAIDRQLDRWGLSPAEKEVALLLLKGLSHKEIGAVRHVSEATVRQQARALYQKGGLNGRHDLAAFFLEDLLDPGPASAPPSR